MIRRKRDGERGGRERQERRERWRDEREGEREMVIEERYLR